MAYKVGTTEDWKTAIRDDSVDELGGVLEAAGFVYVPESKAWRGPLCSTLCSTSIALLLTKQILRGEIPMAVLHP